MSIVLWLVYICLFLCTSVVSIMAVIQRRPPAPQDPALETPLVPDAHEAQIVDVDDAAKHKDDEIKPGQVAPADHATADKDKDQTEHKDAPKTDNETMTSGWV